MKLLITIILIISISCSPVLVEVPSSVWEGFTQKYTGEIYNYKSIFRMDGYFVGIYAKSNQESLPEMFFVDGSFIANFSINHLTDKKYFRNSTTCGTYQINNDIITVQFIHHDFNNSYCLEEQYKIINKETLWLIQTKNLRTFAITKNDSTKRNYLKPLKFVPLVNKPDSSFWMKEKSWFWEDQEKFIEYKQKKRIQN